MMDDLLQEMIDPAPVHRDAARRRRLWTTVAIVGLAAVGATTLTTSAIFTDNDATSATIESGTVDLALGDNAFTFTPQNLAPGSSTFAPLEVKSNGSLALRYSISYFATPVVNPLPDPVLDPPAVRADLSTVLVLNVYAVEQASCSAAGVAGVTPLNAPATASPWPSTASPLVGDNTEGADDGDRDLAVDDSVDWLCFRVDFPRDAGNGFQDAGVRLDLIFNAEQTANNP
ncbi:hypothetical protein [Cellulomonas sp. Leaf395]|jgi:hypothetical protein|uniref:hypothetical protein n=1 Tax=Cellulomonas sp. Leaf395 TaxID=1736362 RepID=UPI0006FE854F|nr:hypothetical protein [Cellulomonas sp. Leaf395]KQS99375.1 hypothetical protein ASG23_08180 [Cellulomonas sp. Leaf395]